MIVVIVSSPFLNQYGDLGKIPDPKKYHSLLNWLDQHHCKLKATFPGIEDESMQVYYELQTPAEIKETDLETLRKIDGIEGAIRLIIPTVPTQQDTIVQFHQ